MDDRTSFEAAVEPVLRPLHAHCYRFVGGLGQADDLVQETLLRAWRKRAELVAVAELPRTAATGQIQRTLLVERIVAGLE